LAAEARSEGMSPLLIDALGVAAAFCSMGSFVPQLVKLWRGKEADAVSLRMFVVAMTGFSLWTAYGIGHRTWALVGSNLVCLALCAAILALKVRYSRK
jgi:MtN3 and saliva related transmembrane protein